ncbi:MAG: cobaltochelatase subunit CobN [Deltaproteobacteria bacterium]|nr:cobaltochelatase subunit CobN [Deltaproteobacteria bacterium]
MSAYRSYTLCYYSAGGMELPSLSDGVLAYRNHGGKIRITARSQTQLFDRSRQESFVRAALQADMVIINLHGGRATCPAFDLLVETMATTAGKRPHLHIQPSGGDEDALAAARDHSSAFGTSTWDSIKQYLNEGGHINFQRLLTFVHNLLFESELPCDPPLKLPCEGIYHPDCKGVPELSEYLRDRVDPARPTVGLWFYQTYWLNHNLAFIDTLIRSIEAQGANVIPVFHQRYKDIERGNRGADYVVEHFFMDHGKPRIDVLISPMMFSLTLTAPEYRSLLSKLDVVCIQALLSMNSFVAWRDSEQGLGSMDVSFSAAQPEFDGNLITVPVATREQETVDPITGGLLTRYRPINERVDKLVRLARNWARLRQLKTSERRVAIIFHQYPPRNDRIGCAAGLDSFASVKQLLDQMQREGYQLERSYASGDDLAEDLLSRMTVDQRWLTPDRMAERTEAVAGPEEYLRWDKELPESIRSKMAADWGEPPGELFVHDDKLLFAGLTNGNIFITIQPPRGYFENIDKAYHDLYLSTPHHYLAQYRWIRDVFKADAVVHVGKHGSLEWLPGKALGLSESCYPDLAIMELPNIYPYIINDPSEGTQAKRRSYACIIDHLTPAFTNADLYEDLGRIENLLNDYQVALSEDPGKVEVLRPMIWAAVTAAHLDQDLAVSQEQALTDFDAFLDRLHSYLQELGDTMIGDGLHTLGMPPDGEQLEEFIVQLTRLANGSVPSLRETVIAAMGHDLDDLLENRGRRCPAYAGHTGGQLIDLAHRQSLAMIQSLARKNWQPQQVAEIAAAHYPAHVEQLSRPLAYIAETLVPNIRRTTEEITATLTALSGGFVKPGPSGAPSRGQADILPTGRNFYSVDPTKIPSPAAWEVGKRLADALLERYRQETGNYPDSIGILVFGGPTMRTRGDDIAEIYYLMGLKPVWQKGSGQVSGLEVIPLSELGRPRLDVVPRVSGFFRDAFPNLMEQIDEAVAMVSALNEPPESNLLRRNVQRDMEELRRQGLDEPEARRQATFRVFSCPPGTYGAGVSELVESKNWQTREDLGNNYIRYSAHAYGKDSYGKQQPAAFRRLLSRMEVTVKNEDSREYDMLSCTDYYNYYGGLIAAAETMRDGPPLSIMGDSADPRRVRMRTTAEEARHVLRSRLVNPKWLAGMKRHGYKGAGDISHMMDVVLGWDATAGVIDDWMYQAVADSYALDPEMQEWMKKVNPYALQNILDKLLEAISRSLWQADRQTEEALRDTYLEMEGEIEERTE